MSLTLLNVRNRYNNIKDHTISYNDAKMPYPICWSYRSPRFEFQVENHGEQQKNDL